DGVERPQLAGGRPDGERAEGAFLPFAGPVRLVGGVQAGAGGGWGPGAEGGGGRGGEPPLRRAPPPALAPPPPPKRFPGPGPAPPSSPSAKPHESVRPFTSRPTNSSSSEAAPENRGSAGSSAAVVTAG